MDLDLCIASPTKSIEPASSTPRELHDNAIMNKKMIDGSNEVVLWTQNAHNSPLLRLPAELRLVIYEHVLAANTPFITYTPDMFEKSDSSELTKAASITILGGVCRQIYMEIANIPNGTSIWTSGGLRTSIHARDPWQ